MLHLSAVIKETDHRSLLPLCLLIAMLLANCARQPAAEADKVIVTVVEDGQEYPYVNSTQAEVIRYFSEFTAGKATAEPDCEPSARIEFLKEGREVITVDLRLDRSANCWTASWADGDKRVTRSLNGRADDFANELLRLARRRYDSSFLATAQAVKS